MERLTAPALPAAEADPPQAGCGAPTKGGYVVFSYGGGVPSERSAAIVSPELAEERLRFLLTIGVMVRDMRIGEGTSQAELAEKVGVSPWTISQMEQGKSAIRSDVLFSIFRTLGSFPDVMRELFEMRFDDNWHPRPIATDPPELRKLTAGRENPAPEK